MENQDRTESIPWQRREDLGFFPALWQTVEQVLFRPLEFFNSLEIKKSQLEPFLFYLTIFTAVAVISELFKKALLRQFSPALFLFLFILPLFVAAAIYIGSAFVHLFVILFGGQGGFIGTFNVLAYNAATGIFNIIPLIGGVVGAVWGAVVVVTGFKKVHNLSTPKALGAYLIPLFILGALLTAGLLMVKLRP